MNLKDTIDQVLRKATRMRPISFPVVTLQSAREVAVANKAFKITAVGDEKYQVELEQMGSAAVTLNLSQTYAVAGMISGIAFAKTMYGSVADNNYFKILYDVQDRPFNYVNGGMTVSKSVSSAPCMVCGLFLPTRNLTIDHQRPQTGGDIEAVLKTFRAFGLTQEGPKGPKGQAIQSYLAASSGFGSTAPTLNKVMPMPGRAPLGGTSVDARYTLNDQGTVLYSFVVAAGQTAELQSQCMHGLINLRPVCGACNSGRGNPLKF
jgi:hypothetical protein